jgi:hypothetical protein
METVIAVNVSDIVSSRSRVAQDGDGIGDWLVGSLGQVVDAVGVDLQPELQPVSGAWAILVTQFRS